MIGSLALLERAQQLDLQRQRDVADLVAHVAERIRTHPDPLLRARAVQIIGIKEGMQAVDRWMDPRGAVIAQDELRRWVRELAAAEDLADLKQAFCLGPEPQRPVQPRIVRLTVAKIDPWSALKLSFLAAIAIASSSTEPASTPCAPKNSSGSRP